MRVFANLFNGFIAALPCLPSLVMWVKVSAEDASAGPRHWLEPAAGPAGRREAAPEARAMPSPATSGVLVCLGPRSGASPPQETEASLNGHLAGEGSLSAVGPSDGGLAHRTGPAHPEGGRRATVNITGRMQAFRNSLTCASKLTFIIDDKRCQLFPLEATGSLHFIFEEISARRSSL